MTDKKVLFIKSSEIGGPLCIAGEHGVSLEAKLREEPPTKTANGFSFSATFDVETTPELESLLHSMNEIHDWMQWRRAAILFGHQTTDAK